MLKRIFVKCQKIVMSRSKNPKLEIILVRKLQKVEMTFDEKSKGRNNIEWKSPKVKMT